MCVEVVDTDCYGRRVRRVYAGDRDLNAEMVRQGAAWVYREYNRDRSLLAVEEEARAARRGLWALPETERVPPWEWRRGERAGTSQETTPPRREVPMTPARQAFACGSKRTCGQMAGCEEARFHLTQCGLSRLDENGDGVPCEKLCR